MVLLVHGILFLAQPSYFFLIMNGYYIQVIIFIYVLRNNILIHFKRITHVFVSLGDGFTCDVTGVGTVKIQMFDGVVLTLNDVAYVPKM